MLAYITLTYLTAGVVFAAWFLFKGASRLDKSAHGISLKVKLLWLPGIMVLWPVLWRRFFKPAQPGGPNPVPARHQRIWLVIAIVLPGLFAWAVIVLPETPLGTPLSATLPPALPTILKRYESEQLLANIRGDSTGAQQIELVLKTPLEAPAALLIQNGHTLGRLSTRGVYRFPVKDAIVSNLEIINPIHRTTITAIPLQ